MSFDPDTFMNQTVDQPMATEFKLCPAGEYRATIDDFDSSAFETFDFTYKQGPNAGLPGSMTKFSIPFVIDSDAAKTELGRDKVVVTKQVILDIDSNGALDFGTNKNVELGRIRAAVNQNGPGPWSPGNLRGQGPVMVKVAHVAFKRNDGTQGQRAEITRIARIS